LPLTKPVHHVLSCSILLQNNPIGLFYLNAKEAGTPCIGLFNLTAKKAGTRRIGLFYLTAKEASTPCIGLFYLTMKKTVHHVLACSALL
jgi:hypothetical protein